MRDTVRQAGRVLVLREDGAALLFEFKDPVDGRRFWITPGGGLDPDETHEQGAIRELFEETGIRVEAGCMPEIGRRTLAIRYGTHRFTQAERYFLLRVGGGCAVSTQGHLDYERTDLADWGWLTAEDIEARQAAGERFGPEALAPLIRRMLEQGPPDRPLSL